MASLTSLMMELSSSLGVTGFNIVFFRGVIIDTERDVSVLTRVVTVFRCVRILTRSPASFASVSQDTNVLDILLDILVHLGRIDSRMLLHINMF